MHPKTGAKNGAKALLADRLHPKCLPAHADSLCFLGLDTGKHHPNKNASSNKARVRGVMGVPFSPLIISSSTSPKERPGSKDICRWKLLIFVASYLHKLNLVIVLEDHLLHLQIQNKRLLPPVAE